MIAVVQRTKAGKVIVDGNTVGQIGAGMVVLVAVHDGDGLNDVQWIVMKHALSVVDDLSMAKVLGTGSGLIQQANNAAVLFGFDAGRASIINDLHTLAKVPEENPIIEPSYRGEF